MAKALPVISLIALLILSASGAEPTTGNLVANGSFELDWHNSKAQPGLITQYNTLRFGQSDKIPDGWVFPLNLLDQVTLEEDNGYNSRKSINITGNAQVTITQSLPFCAYSHELGKQLYRGMKPGGAFRSPEPSKFFRNIRGYFYVKALGLPENSYVHVVISVGNLNKTAKVNLPAVDWTKTGFQITAEEMAQFFRAGALPPQIKIGITTRGLGEGNVWFDNFYLEEDFGEGINLVSDAWGSFEKGREYPEGWSAQKKFRWFGSSQYYMWRGWSDYFSRNRGEVTVDNVIVHSGRQSLRMSVYPGDEKYVESPEILINQTDTRPIEIGLWVKANRAMLVDLKAVNEKGDYLSDYDLIIAGHASNPYGRTINPNVLFTGTYDWRYLRKIVGWNKPVRSLRVQLVGRGNNGDIDDCVDTKQTTNQVATIWWDDLRVVERETTPNELTARGISAQKPEAPLPQTGITVEDLDFGERLFGENSLKITLNSTIQKRIPVRAELIYPSGQRRILYKGRFAAKKNSETTIDIPYEITALCRNRDEQYRMNVEIDGRKTSIAFGTRPEIMQVRLERVYPFPEETAQICYMNFGVAEKTLDKARMAYLGIQKRHSKGIDYDKKTFDFQRELAEFRKKQPLNKWKVDEFNFFQKTIDMTRLPIHPENEPVRNFLAVFEAYDKNGDVLFSGRSPHFGRLARNTEKLEPVKTVEVRDGLMYVNDKPFYLRACLGHWWNLSSAPSNDGFAWSKKHTVKDMGFNAFFPNTPYSLDDAKTYSCEDWWKQNLYTAIWFPHPYHGIYSKDADKLDTVLRDCEKVAANPYILMVSPQTFWEGGLNVDICDKPDVLKREAALVDKIRKASKRPQFTSAGYNAYKQQAGYYFDVIAPESNYIGPTELPAMFFNAIDPEYKTKMSMTFPNIFNDCPLQMMRFETYEGIIRGQRGFIQIGEFNDPTCFRGMNGELRWLERIMFTREKGPEVKTNIDLSMMQRKVANKLIVIATTAQPVEHGLWSWVSNASSGKKSHTGVMMRHANNPEETYGYAMHGWRESKLVQLKKGDVIKQDVFVPANADVDHLIILFRGNGKWDFNVTLGNFNWKKFSESGAKAQFCPELFMWMYEIWYGPKDMLDRLLLKEETFRSLGNLPEKEKWVTLEIPVENIGLDGKCVDGFAFASHGNTVLWDNTRVVSGNNEAVLCDDYICYPQEFWKEVRFSVPGLKKGTEVKVVFEDRKIISDDGFFADDLSGEPVYRNIWKGMYGDWTPTLKEYQYGGYHYHYDPAEVRIYEIPLK